MRVFEDKKHHKKKDQSCQTVPLDGQKGKKEMLNEAAGGEPGKKKKKKKKKKVCNLMYSKKKKKADIQIK